jgi:hypothetical protein
MLLESQEQEGRPSYTGWSKRSYIVLLVVFVLNVDNGQMYRLSMLTTNVSRLDVPSCDLVFMRL